MLASISIILFICVTTSCYSLKPLAPKYYHSISSRYTDLQQRKTRCLFNNAEKEDLPITAESESKKEDFEETTKKYGLEVGLFKALTTKNTQSVKPQELLAKYGVAYLATSITLAIISYAVCFALVSNGIDVSTLLAKVGINVSGAAATNAGTAAIAYAVHKAASPIRFPPTVALTPIVANWLGKKPSNSNSNSNTSE